MSAAHTPGPWALGGTHGHQYIRITADNHAKIVGTVRDCEMDGLDNHGMHRWVQTDEGRANARLIAAAPDLVEALTFAVRFFDQLTPGDAERMRKVLDKATGSGS